MDNLANAMVSGVNISIWGLWNTMNITKANGVREMKRFTATVRIRMERKMGPSLREY